MIPRLYPVTDRSLAGGRDHATIVSLLCGGGATLIQLREKSLGDRDLLEAAIAAVAAARRGGAGLVVNDRPDIAALAGAAGVHVGGDDLPPAETRGLLGPSAFIGCSTHGVEEAIAASALPVDYVALGPIFETSHAAVNRPPVGVDGVRRAAAASRVPLVAIGGIDLDRAADVLSAGAASVAVMGDLMTAPDIPARVAAYLSIRT